MAEAGRQAVTFDTYEEAAAEAEKLMKNRCTPMYPTTQRKEKWSWRKRLPRHEAAAVTSSLTLGSLFDGIGGFPLAGVRQGFTPVWASEIEPFPIQVTKIRFPDMLHVGDITRLKGAELTPVDVVCGGQSVPGPQCGKRQTRRTAGRAFGPVHGAGPCDQGDESL